MADVDAKTGRPVVTSAGKFMGWNTIFGRDGDKGEPYMTRIWFWRLRLHIFHRGDNDPDPHDHPWDFWTFPLTSYVEEVTVPFLADGIREFGTGLAGNGSDQLVRRQIVPAFRLSYRPATHTHRVLGAYYGIVEDSEGYGFEYSAKRAATLPDWMYKPWVHPSKKIITLVWRSGEYRRWGFLKARDGRYCWVHWKEYVVGGGKDSPCQ